MKKIKLPKTLNSKWMTEARLPLVVEPIADNKAGEQEPILDPKIKDGSGHCHGKNNGSDGTRRLG